MADHIQISESKLALRKLAAIKMLFGVAGAIGAFLLFRATYASGHRPGGLEAAGYAVPGAVALMGLLEFVSGTPFRDWSDRWDSLKGWQRGVLGTATFLVALAIFVVGVVIWLEHQ